MRIASGQSLQVVFLSRRILFPPPGAVACVQACLDGGSLSLPLRADIYELEDVTDFHLLLTEEGKEAARRLLWCLNALHGALEFCPVRSEYVRGRRTEPV